MTDLIERLTACDEAIDRIDYLDRIANELQDTVHKQAQRITELEKECEMYKAAFKTVDEKWTECSNKVARLTYLVNKTYYIDECDQLHQVLMDNLLADVAMDVPVSVDCI